MIDTSGSIGSSRFQLIRDFTANITTQLIYSFARSAIGVILFDSSADIHINLQEYTSLDTLLSAINQLPYNGGGTDTAGALTLLLSSAQNGKLGLRSDSFKVAIVITDGQSDYPPETLSAASTLHASNIFDVYAIGVDGTDPTELETIASSPEFLSFTSSFSTVDLIHESTPQLCNCK